MSKYVHTPNVVTLQDVVNKDFTLSSSQYVNLVMPNKNYKYVREFLSRPLLREDLGVEVGSLSYIDKSPFRFIRKFFFSILTGESLLFSIFIFTAMKYLFLDIIFPPWSVLVK